jgi:mono/diheme cytochrome c family protein
MPSPSASSAGQHLVAAAAAIMIAASALSGVASGQSKRENIRSPDPDQGRAISERLCTGCHVVGTVSDTGGVPAGVPSFAAIAAKPGQTTASTAGAIVVPHPPMPDTSLTRDEIADVAAYILSLRK